MVDFFINFFLVVMYFVSQRPYKQIAPGKCRLADRSENVIILNWLLVGRY